MRHATTHPEAREAQRGLSNDSIARTQITSQIAELTAKRKELMSGNFRDKHWLRAAHSMPPAILAGDAAALLFS
eukprot:19678-Rhodomonas_salina.1